MKSHFRILIVTLMFSTSLLHGQASFVWQSRAQLPGPARWGAFTFEADGYGYVAGGSNATTFYSDVWRYDPSTDSWSQMASMPGPRRHGASWSMNGKGYVTCGQITNTSYSNALWEYDPATNAWTVLAPLPATGRYGPHGFALNGSGYLGGGNYGSATGPYLGDMWRYDRTSNTWTEISGIPGQARYGATSFITSGKGFVNGGRLADLTFTNQMWEFNGTTETWTQTTPMPGPGRSWTMAMEFENDVILACGKDGSDVVLSDGYRYAPTTGSWSSIPNYPGNSGWSGASFAIGGRVFGGLGRVILPSNSYHKDWWELVRVEDECENPPAADLGPDVLLCPGAELALSVVPNGHPVLWSDGTNGSSIVLDSPGQYWVQIGEGACAVSDTVLVLEGSVPDISIVGVAELTCEVDCIQLMVQGAGPGATLVWSTGALTASIEVCEPGGYNVTVTPSVDGCAGTAEVSIAQNSGVPKFSVSDAVLPCDGGCTTLEAMSAIAGLQFEWSGPGGGSGSGASFQACVPGEYVLVGTNAANGCSVELNATVTQTDAVPGIVVSGGTITCLDPCVTLVVSSAGVDVGYSWWGPTGGGDGPSLEVCVPGEYTVVANGGDYCPTSVTVIVAEDVDGPEITAEGGTLNCLASGVTLEAAGNGSFLWTGPEGFTSTEQSPTVSVAGTYLLTVEGENGCQSAASVEVMLETEEPGASALGAVIGCDVGSVMILGEGNGTFAWTGPNGFSSVEQNPMTSVPGTYTLIVTGSNGCTSSATAVVSEDECDECGSLVVSCSADVTIECGMSDHPLDVGAPIFRKTLTCPEVSVGWTDQWFGACPWTLVRTWTATDGTGAVEVCIQTITIVDSQAPAFICPKPTEIVVDCSSIPAPEVCVAEDACDPNVAVTFSETKTGDGCEEDYVITRTYVATDECGNTNSFEQVIHVMNGNKYGHMINPRGFGSGVTVSPNPFQHESTIQFKADESGMAIVEVTDIQGRLIAVLHNARVEMGQEVRVRFQPESGSSGSFLYRVILNGREERGRLIQLR